jgi:catalase
MRVDGNYGSTKGYEPNSFGEWAEQLQTKESPLKLTGDADNWNYREDDSDYYTQPRDLFLLMSKEQQQILFDNTARSIGGADLAVKHRHIVNCYKAHKEYGEGVANSLDIDVYSALKN